MRDASSDRHSATDTMPHARLHSDPDADSHAFTDAIRDTLANHYGNRTVPANLYVYSDAVTDTIADADPEPVSGGSWSAGSLQVLRRRLTIGGEFRQPS